MAEPVRLKDSFSYYLNAQVAGSCDLGNDPLVSIKFREFPEQLRNCSLLEKDSAPCGWLECIAQGGQGDPILGQTMHKVLIHNFFNALREF